MNITEIRNEAIEISKAHHNDDEFLPKVMNASPAVIAALMPLLSNRDSSLYLESRRDLCKAVLQSKLNSDLIVTMTKLDKSAGFLAWVGIFVGIIVGIAQIVIPLWVK